MNNFTLGRASLSNGVSIHFAAKGDTANVPTIFLHGYIDSWRSFMGVLSELSPEFFSIAVDLRGHGDSDKPTSGYSIRDFAEDLVLFMDALELYKVKLVGHSMGSFIAQSLAAHYPQRIEQLVLISSAASASDNSVLRDIKPNVDALQDPIDRNVVAGFQAPSTPLPREVMDMIISESMKVPARVWRSALSGLLEVDHRPILQNIVAPTLILWGNQDGIFTQRDQKELLSKIRDSSLKEYDAGHALHWERPKEVAGALKKFLK